MKFLFQILLVILCSHFTLLSQDFSSELFEGETDEYLLHNAFTFSKNAPDKDLVDISQIDPTLSAECEPLTTVGNCVNVLSGHFFQIDKDLTGNTIEPLHLIRFYDSGNTTETLLGFGFGTQFPLWASDIQESARHNYALISERLRAFHTDVNFSW